MSVKDNIRNIHKEIQQNISVMLPERYKKLCLYASVIEGYDMSSGEMFFYYFPNGIIKKNPINVYEIPELFNFDEEQYRKLENRLYESIRKLRKYCVKIGEKPWSNVTITMEGTKYTVEYNYDDLITSEFSNYERHLIWRYKYLNVPLESYSKKDRVAVEKYFESDECKNSKTNIYEENVYERQVNKIPVYNSVEARDDYQKKEEVKREKEIKEVKKVKETKKEDEKKPNEDNQNRVVKNQLLNF